MGYYTTFEISTKENKYPITDIVTYMQRKQKKYDWFYPFEYNFDDYIEDDCIEDFELYGEQAKWYEFDKEMKTLSRQFPDTVFCLYGEGEESRDVWYRYYKNGKLQYCPAKIAFDEYDESKLV